MHTFRTLIAITSCALAVSIQAQAAQSSSSADEVAIRQLMEQYHQAVVEHDGKHLASLFVPSGAAWFNVLSNEAYDRVRAKTPDAQKARSGTVQGFVDFVNTSKATLDPQHGPVRVQTDGAIASVYFDFRFVIDGKIENRGQESWQLVRAAEGWRIASIVYSSTPAQG